MGEPLIKRVRPRGTSAAANASRAACWYSGSGSIVEHAVVGHPGQQPQTGHADPGAHFDDRLGAGHAGQERERRPTAAMGWAPPRRRRRAR